jgi:hypothetical protein
VHFQVCGGEEKVRNTRACSLVSPGGAGRGEAKRGDGRGCTTYV